MGGRMRTGAAGSRLNGGFLTHQFPSVRPPHLNAQGQRVVYFCRCNIEYGMIFTFGEIYFTCLMVLISHIASIYQTQSDFVILKMQNKLIQRSHSANRII
nr:Protein of unknown function [Gryllus bimaculatus]